MVPVPSEGLSSEMPDKQLPRNLLADFITDFESQEGTEASPTSLAKVKLPSKQGSSDLKMFVSKGTTGTPNKLWPTLKKLNVADDIAYSFASSEKGKKDNVVASLVNYNQIDGLQSEREGENLNPEDQLSISPTKVKRTPIADLRRSRYQMSFVESLRTAHCNGSDDSINVGCFSSMKINSGIHLDRLAKCGVSGNHNKVGLITVSEMLVSKMTSDVGGLIKHESMLEIMPNEATFGPRLDLDCLKKALLCGVNTYPVDIDQLPEADLQTYDAIFDFLGSAAPGIRSSGGVANVKRLRDHFNYLKFGAVKKMQFSLMFLGAFRMGQMFAIKESQVLSNSPQKNKMPRFYHKIELRLIDWSDGVGQQVAACICEYCKEQELNYDFETSFKAILVQEQNELKKLRLEVWASSANDQGLLVRLCSKNIFPAFMLPGYRSVYFSADSGSHLVLLLKIFQID